MFGSPDRQKFGKNLFVGKNFFTREFTLFCWKTFFFNNNICFAMKRKLPKIECDSVTVASCSWHLLCWAIIKKYLGARTWAILLFLKVQNSAFPEKIFIGEGSLKKDLSNLIAVCSIDLIINRSTGVYIFQSFTGTLFDPKIAKLCFWKHFFVVVFFLLFWSKTSRGTTSAKTFLHQNCYEHLFHSGCNDGIYIHVSNE